MKCHCAYIVMSKNKTKQKTWHENKSFCRSWEDAEVNIASKYAKMAWAL